MLPVVSCPETIDTDNSKLPAALVALNVLEIDAVDTGEKTGYVESENADADEPDNMLLASVGCQLLTLLVPLNSPSTNRTLGTLNATILLLAILATWSFALKVFS